jgi:hypothetical protein
LLADACHLEIHDGGQPRAAEGGAADVVQAFDVDADGTNELVLSGYYSPGDCGRIEVLCWDGEAGLSLGPRRRGPGRPRPVLCRR